MIGLREVQRLAFDRQVPEQAIERDYILTWVLIEIARHPTLGTQAILKGGTAIKKLYVADWRYSEDLDFTLLAELEADRLSIALGEISIACARSAGLEITLASQEQHATGNITAYLGYIGPLRRTRRLRELKVDFSTDEAIAEKPPRLPLIRTYSDEPEPSPTVLMYSLEEILAEKMRAIFQRTEPRDLYDVWRLLDNHSAELDLPSVARIFAAKCSAKSIQPDANFLSTDRVERFSIAWERRLGEQITDLPPINSVVREMRRFWRTHFA